MIGNSPLLENLFWNQNQCLNSDDEDPFFEDNLPDGFYELSDSIYEYDGEIEEAKAALIAAGFEEKVLF